MSCRQTQVWRIAADRTGGRSVFVEIEFRPGRGIPVNVHVGEDETFYVLSGSVRFEGDDIAAEGEVPGAATEAMCGEVADLEARQGRAAAPGQVAEICGRHGIVFDAP